MAEADSLEAWVLVGAHGPSQSQAALALPITVWVTLEQLASLTVPQFPHL